MAQEKNGLWKYHMRKRIQKFFIRHERILVTANIIAEHFCTLFFNKAGFLTHSGQSIIFF